MPDLDSDNFNRADSDALGTSLGGFTWVEAVGDLDIVTNGVEGPATGNNLAYLNRDLGNVDHYMEADITLPGGVTSCFGAVVVRKAADAVQTFYSGSWEVFNGTTYIRINRYVAGTKVVLATQTGYGAVGETHRLRLEIQGTTLRLYSDSVLIFTVTDSQIAANTRIGINVFKYAANASARIEAVTVIGSADVAEPPVNVNFGSHLFIWDSFQRADSTTLGNTAFFPFRSWAEISGNLALVSNTVRSTAGAGVWSIGRLNGGPGGMGVGRSYTEIRGRVLATGDAVMACVNKDQNSTQTFYAAQLRVESGVVRLKVVRWSAGTETVLANIAFGQLNTWYVLQCSYKVNEIVAFVDGVERLRVIDTVLAATGDVPAIAIMAGGQISKAVWGCLADEFSTPSGATFESGTRDATLYPFDALSPWNRPIGSGATFTPVVGQFAATLWNNGPGFNSAINGSTFALHYAAASDPLGGLYEETDPNVGYHELYRIHIPAGFVIANEGITDPNVEFIDPDGEYCYICQSGCNRYLDGVRARNIKRVRLKDSSRFANFHGSTEDGAGGHIHCLIRLGEILQAGGIKHCLGAVMWEEHLNDDHIWPANNHGSWSPSLPADQTSNLRMGTLLAIPPSVNINNLGITNTYALRIVECLQRYGMYIYDKGAASPTFRVDYFARNDAGGIWNNAAFRSDVRLGLLQLQVVSNNSATAIGGGGTPGRPLLASFGTPAPSPVGRNLLLEWDILPLASGPVGSNLTLSWDISGAVGSTLVLLWQVEGPAVAGLRTVRVLRDVRTVKRLASVRKVKRLPTDRKVDILPMSRTFRRVLS